MSVTAIIRLRAKAGAEQAFLEHMQRPLQLTRDNPECSYAELFASAADPQAFVLIETWSSIEAHDAHFGALMEAGELEACMPTWDGMPESTHYSAVD